MKPFKLLYALTPLLLFATSVTTFTERPAWTIDTAHLRVTVLRGGGHVAEIVLKSAGSINPLWIQERPTIDPSRYTTARDSRTYGGGPAAKLMSGLAGHSLCFPYWGNPSAAEERAGMTFHGETGVVDWTSTGSGSDWLELSAELPQSHTRFTRRLTLHGTVVWFDEIAGNEAAWDRPVGWCEHVTIGAPFLERGVTTFTASATRGREVVGLRSRSGPAMAAGVGKRTGDRSELGAQRQDRRRSQYLPRRPLPPIRLFRRL